MAGPTITLNKSLNVSGGPGAAGGAGGGGSIVGDLDTVSGQVRQQTEQFGTLVKDPNFTGQSEMGAMLKLQREMGLEQLMFSTITNLMKARSDTNKQISQNIK
jgi:hypothetical protein